MKESSVKNYTHGGQITLHNIRMLIQITQKVCLVAAVIFLIVDWGKFGGFTDRFGTFDLRMY